MCTGSDWKVWMYSLWASAAFFLSSLLLVLLTDRWGEKVAMVWDHGDMANMSIWGIAGEEHEVSLVRHVILGGFLLLGRNLSGWRGGAG